MHRLTTLVAARTSKTKPYSQQNNKAFSPPLTSIGEAFCISRLQGPPSWEEAHQR